MGILTRSTVRGFLPPLTSEHQKVGTFWCVGIPSCVRSIGSWHEFFFRDLAYNRFCVILFSIIIRIVLRSKVVARPSSKMVA